MNEPDDAPVYEPFERVRFFDGQILTADDLRAEQEYAAAKRRLHNRALHGFGVVSGLGVEVDAQSDPSRLVVSPGLALSPSGDEIVVNERVLVDVGANLSGCRASIVVRYVEGLVDPVPVISPDGEEVLQATRTREGFVVEVVDTPGDDDVVLATVDIASDSASAGALTRLRDLQQVGRQAWRDFSSR